MKKIINTAKAPAPIGPYNQAILIGKTLYTSGQIALNPIFQLQDFLRISHNFQYCCRMEKVLQQNMKEGQSILDSWKDFLILQEFFYPENNESVCIKFAHFFHSLKHKLNQKNSHHFELQFLTFLQILFGEVLFFAWIILFMIRNFYVICIWSLSN